MQLNSESYREKMKIWEASSLVLSFRKRERDVIEEGQEAKRWVLQLNFSPRNSHQSCSNVTGEESDSYLLRNGEIREAG